MSDDAVTDTTENDELQGEEAEPVDDDSDDEEVPFAPTDVPDPGPVEDDEAAP
jgi:hypothetical protein